MFRYGYSGQIEGDNLPPVFKGNFRQMLKNADVPYMQMPQLLIGLLLMCMPIWSE